ncbi:hypothetical protein LZY01_23780 [Levilactobacillus zymae]|uniref:Uncharacterized protein n=1 Tax=Levilactobacillus zymae TaxID=267363 RepID=A0ABQ0WZ63_9LACO|nr:hypothetical protein [Levilactobacillus zymae]KRL07892.1 hypothetical protein FD38_GL002456 [Levilactobacillus zymae DSM 19395]QFR61044.1 hypothetical protein LZ395_05665 [Levilactobacillus zymae]GEO73210.1 hypothetical protein LZY01_23780 [Levilactobacillus zymae]
MKPSEKVQKFILDFLFDHNEEVTLEIFKELLSTAKQNGYSELKIVKCIQHMGNDADNLGLLQVNLPLDAFGNGTLNTSLADSWLSPKGEDYLDNLNHPKNNDDHSSQTINIGNLGNASFGNNNKNSFTSDNSTNINVNAEVDKLLLYKDQLNSSKDQDELSAFAETLRELLNREEAPKTGSLSKFGNFLGKTWKTISPVAAPLLVELAKKAFF